MLYITRKSCVFPRQMELPATQEETANPGKSPTNPRLIPANGIRCYTHKVRLRRLKKTPSIYGESPANRIRCYTNKVRLRGLKKQGN